MKPAGVVALGLILFLLIGFTDGHSASYNYPWAVQYVDAFGADALLPRHVPGLWAGLGGHDFFFYGPLPFWVIATSVAPFCHGCATETQIVLGAAIFWILSGLTFYLFIRRHCRARPAAIGAIAYTLLPYHFWIDWLGRQAFAEFAAYAFIPLIALGFDAIRKEQRRGWILSIGVAGTALCHLPSMLLACHVFGAVALVVFWQKYRANDHPMNFIARLTGWSILGVLLSCFYWLPALSLLKTVSPDFLYGQHYIATDWLYGLQFLQPNPQFAWVVFLSFVVLMPVVVTMVAFTRGALRLWVGVPIVLSLFLNLEISAFIWENWIIAKVQFPWRLMVFVDFAAAVAISALLAHMPDLPRKNLVLSALLILTITPAVRFAEWAVHELNDKFETEHDWVGAQEYLSPETYAILLDRLKGESAMNDRDQVAREIEQIAINAKAASQPFAKVEIHPRRVIVDPIRDALRLPVPVQFWSLWQAELDGGVALDLRPNARFGTIDIIAPADGFKGRSVTLTLPYQSSEKISFAISLGALLVMIFTVLRPTRFRQLHEDNHS